VPKASEIAVTEIVSSMVLTAGRQNAWSIHSSR